MIDVVWDMETNDPDDFLTLLFLAGHRQVNLKAVTILPGSPHQIGFVRHALREWFNRDIPIGVQNIDTPKPSVSQWHYDAFGDISPSQDSQPAAKVLLEQCDENTTLITGAALTNLHEAILMSGAQLRVGRLVAQGGFAGEGVVPPELQLDKFKGLKTSPTHNLITDNKAASAVLDYKGIARKLFVSKNVCHRVFYDQKMHEVIGRIKNNHPSLSRIWQGMDVYLKQNPLGKMLHDPLAACCAVDETIGKWAEVELYREGNAWGARLASSSKTWIITDYDHEKLMSVFTAV